MTQSAASEGFGAIRAVMCVKTELLLFSIHSLVIPSPNFLPIFVHNSLLYFYNLLKSIYTQTNKYICIYNFRTASC